MRFGIQLPRDGPLAGPAAIEATAQAAAELDYASVWSSSIEQLAVVAACTADLPLALLIAGGSATGRIAREARQRLGARLTMIGAPEADLAAARRMVEGSLFLSTGSAPPRSDLADGWAPQVDRAATQVQWWIPRADQLLVLRVSGGISSAIDLRLLSATHTDQLVMSVPAAQHLDQQLAVFAATAEGIAATG